MKKLFKIVFMEINQIREAIDQVINQLQGLRDSLGHDQSISEEMLRKIAQKICLFCGKKIEGDTHSRGCHSNCAQAIRRKIRDGVITDAQAVIEGYWAPPQKGGRPPISNVFSEASHKMKLADISKKADEELESVNAAAEEVRRKNAKAKKKTTKKKKAN